MKFSEILRRKPLVSLLLVLAVSLACCAGQGNTQDKPFSPPDNAYVVAREGEGFVEEINGQTIIHLKGSYAEMGRQHGKMCPDKVREALEWFLYDTAIPQGLTVEKLLGIYKQAEPFIPQSYKDEMKAIAEAAGVKPEEVVALNMIPEKWHCTGSAVWGEATVDGKLYHHRSLDYAINIGKKKRGQENAALIIYEPEGENPYAVVGWAGFIGCVTGMNAKGIGIGEMGSSSDDESLAGLPMTFMLREILSKASTLDEGMKMFRELPRTCGYNFILSDGNIPDAVAVEVTHSKIAFFRQDDPAENQPPHTPMKFAVRRCNHFVSPELAATQRKVYDPQKSDAGSWLGYDMLTNYIQTHYGKLDGQGMIGLCRMYPPTHECLHQAVMCPTDLRFWVSNALDPQKVVYAGAQNQRFYEYNLGDLLKTKADMLKPRPANLPATEPNAAAREQSGKYRTRTLDTSDVKDEKLLALLREFDTPAEEFEWKMTNLRTAEDYSVWELSFPSPRKSGIEEVDVVWMRYFKPVKDGKVPATVLLHHLQDDQMLEEVVASQLAMNGIATLLLTFPYYGKRAPKDPSKQLEMLGKDMDATLKAFHQGICDARRAGDWLIQRPEVDPKLVSLTGISLGGLCAALTAGVDTSFHKVVPVIAGGDIAHVIFSAKILESVREKLKNDGKTEDSVRESLIPIEPLTYAHRVNKDKVLMINAKFDEIIPKSCTTALAEKMGGVTVVWYECNHEMILAYFKDIVKRLTEFLSK